MRKHKASQAKHLQICLTIPSQFFAGNSNTQPNQSLALLQNNHDANKNQDKQNVAWTRDIIRLGSKKKKLKNQKLSNSNIFTTPKEQLTQTKIKKQHTLNKYFQSNKKFLSNSTMLNSKENADFAQREQLNYRKRQKTQLSNQKLGKISRNLTFNNTKQFKTNKSTQKKFISRNSSKGNLQRSRQDRSCSLNRKLKNELQVAKLQSRLQKIKQYRFVEQYLSDLQLQGIFNQLQISGTPETRWGLIIVDKVYELIRRKDFNHPHTQIIRKF